MTHRLRRSIPQQSRYGIYMGAVLRMRIQNHPDNYFIRSRKSRPNVTGVMHNISCKWNLRAEINWSRVDLKPTDKYWLNTAVLNRSGRWTDLGSDIFSLISGDLIKEDWPRLTNENISDPRSVQRPDRSSTQRSGNTWFANGVDKSQNFVFHEGFLPWL